MIQIPEVTVSRISVVRGQGEPIADLALRAAREALNPQPSTLNHLPRAVIAATFSNPDRFPSLAVRIAAALGLPSSTPAFDLQLACSAFPYAVYLAGKLSADVGGDVLVIDGDVQSPLVDKDDHATGHIFSDAVTACLVSSGEIHDCSPSPLAFASSNFDFLSKFDAALTCPAAGPIRMDGFKVFSFVATEVSAFLREFGTDFDFFAPHQANPYMVRQLAKTLGLESKLLTIDDAVLNPGSCSVAMALANAPHAGRALIAGFGAGYSASAGVISLEK